MLNMVTAAKVGTTAVVIAFVYYGLWGAALSSVSDDSAASIFREPEDEKKKTRFSNSQDKIRTPSSIRLSDPYRECKSGGNILVF